MKNLKEVAKKIWNDESGQGATEYILILVAIVALATTFSGQIKTAVGEKITALADMIGGFQ